MESHQRYLAEEVAYDHADGLLSRREALRRLGLMGFTALGASTLLAACGGSDDDGETATQQPATSAAPAGATTTVPAVPTEAITYPGRTGTVMGAYARAGTARGAVLVIHENRGLNDHIRSVAGRLAASGYSALAVDLLSAEGGSAKVGEANAGAALNGAPAGRFEDDMTSSLDELARRQQGAKLGIVGFCFGGTVTWSLLNRGEPRLAAAAPFYGTVPDNPDFSKSKAAVLGVYAELDGRVNATRERAKSALEKASLQHELRTFPGAEHGFFNETSPRHNPAQAAAAYQALLDWFGRHLA